MPQKTGVNNGALVGGLLLVAAIGIGAYFGLRKNVESPMVQPRAEIPAPPPIDDTPPAPEPRYPLQTAMGAPDAQPEAALPDLADSDTAILAALATLFGNEPMQFYVNREFVIQRIVTTVDNLPRKKLAPQGNPVRPVPGTLVADGDDDSKVLGVANYARYAPYIAAANAVDADALANAYRRFYPLFQQAYGELGAPDAYFNDRVVEVIDHLLAAGDAPPPVRLQRAKNAWAFVDPSLEALSAGEKLMIRVGPEQSAQLKRKLAALRVALTNPAPPEGVESPPVESPTDESPTDEVGPPAEG